MSSLEVRCSEAYILFAESYNIAPPLPRPLRSRYLLRYITADGILLESMLVAPLSDGEQALLENQYEGISLLGPQEDDDQAQSQTKNLTLYLRKSREFAIVHGEFAEHYRNLISRSSGVNLLASTLVSAAVLVNLRIPSTLLAIIVLITGVLKSWSLYAKWDSLEANHHNSCRRFEDISDRMENLLAELTSYEKDFLSAQFRSEPSSTSDAGGKNSESLGSFIRLDTAMAAKMHQKRMNVKSMACFRQKHRTQQITEPVSDVGNAPDSVRQRLRLLYRQSVEYRIAHSLYESKYRKYRLALAFLHRLVSSATSAAMFLDLHGGVLTVLSLSLTAVNTVMQSVGFAEKEGAHLQARISWASIQRSFGTVLMTAHIDEMKRRFTELAEKFQDVKDNVTVELLGLEAYKDEHGRPMFGLIKSKLEISDGTFLQVALRKTPCCRRRRNARKVEVAGDRTTLNVESARETAVGPLADTRVVTREATQANSGEYKRLDALERGDLRLGGASASSRLSPLPSQLPIPEDPAEAPTTKLEVEAAALCFKP